jgi:hypothetical protein
MMERHNIEGRSPREIANQLIEEFDRYARRRGPSLPPEEFEKMATQDGRRLLIPELD